MRGSKSDLKVRWWRQGLLAAFLVSDSDHSASNDRPSKGCSKEVNILQNMVIDVKIFSYREEKGKQPRRWHWPGQPGRLAQSRILA